MLPVLFSPFDTVPLLKSPSLITQFAIYLFIFATFTQLFYFLFFYARLAFYVPEKIEIVEEDPLDFLSYYDLGHAYLALGRHEEEVQAYKEALKLNPKYAQAHYNLSMAYDHMKIGEKAINHMQKALDLYATKRNHRKIRTTQRQLKRFYMSYPGEAGSASSEKYRNR